ncbi:MAG: hypothetical protein DRI57_11600, partial [Deltaproteobacteria bacterium]
RVLLFLSCRNYLRETVSDRLRQPGIQDKSCKYRKLDSPAPAPVGLTSPADWKPDRGLRTYEML